MRLLSLTPALRSHRVMTGLGPATHVFPSCHTPKPWVAGRSLASGA